MAEEQLCAAVEVVGYHTALGHSLNLKNSTTDRAGQNFFFKNSHFRFRTNFSLNQGSVFTLLKCAQSIPRIKLTLEGSFLEKSQKLKKALIQGKIGFEAKMIIFAFAFSLQN